VEAGFPSDRIVVKPNFVDFQVPPEPDRRNGALFVGRLDEHKGLRTLFDAWEAMPMGTELTVVGDGPLREDLEARAASLPTVKILGWKQPEEVHRLMRSAQVLVMPSLWYEGLPMVLLEAFACATPVVASRIGAFSEAVSDGVSGRLVTPGIPHELASAILEFLGPKPVGWVTGAGDEAFAAYRSHYAMEANIPQLIDCYEAAQAHRSEASRPQR